DPGPSGRLGAWGIAGISPDACDVLSKRSVEIAEHLEDLGIDGYQAANVAARATRETKTDTSPDEPLPRWHAEHSAVGPPPDDLPPAARRGSRQRAYCPAEVLVDEREIARPLDRLAAGISPPLHHGPLIGIARTQARLGQFLSRGQKAAVEAICGPSRFVVLE